MKFIKKVAILLIMTVALFLLLAFFVNNEYTIIKRIDIDADQSEVFE